VGVVEGPPLGSGGRAGSDIDGNLSEDASSDKVRGVKSFVKIPKISKIRKRGEAKHEAFPVLKSALYIKVEKV
jgi:hypothetical protein